MRHHGVWVLVVALLVALAARVGVPVATAGDIEVARPDPTYIDYTPMGYYGPPDEWNLPNQAGSYTVPLPTGGPPSPNDPNPSGKWVAYDTNVWESLALPSRHPGDNCNTLTAAEQADLGCQAGDLDPDDDLQPGGSGPTGYRGPLGSSSVHGVCPPSPNPAFTPWGECFNNQLEYLDHYERSMQEMLGDFGVVLHRYGFTSPGDSLTGERGTYLAAAGGQAYNIAAVVPGADHPEETVLVSGHFDFTDSGPAAAWDSAEGHAEVMRMAYIMSDYWRKTGTRPSATVKFIPWDSEESGTHGSLDYVRNNIPPGQEAKVRGYFNVDPCGGAYPAFKDGDFTQRVPLVMQLANPVNLAEGSPDRARVTSFNERAETVVDEVFDYLDDTLTTPAGEVPIFVSRAEAAAGGPTSQRDEIVTAVGGLQLFSSDYRNFEALGIPIFNLFPDYFGPHADGTPASADGATILHSPNDNLARLNRLTSGLTTPGNLPDPTGTFASEGWAKGMELCSQIEAWYMLQPEMAGARARSTDPVAYFEALPNEAIAGEAVTFDASGSHQYANTTALALVPESNLRYEWDFGDGKRARGRTVDHSYSKVGRYQAVLTVRNVKTGQRDRMTLPITVVPSNFRPPELDPVDPADAEDGQFTLRWGFAADRAGFSHFSVEQSTDLATLLSEDAEQANAIGDKWEGTRTTSDPRVQSWQRSDSATSKWMGNKRRSGAASFWAGVRPEDSNPPPTSAESILTLKNSLVLPETTAIDLEYWSLCKNESDDRCLVQIALDGGDAGHEHWDTIDTIGGTEDTFIAGDNYELEPRRVNLGGFAGKTIRLRFVYRLGPSAPALSQPAGWYVDDIRISAGTFREIGTTTEQAFGIGVNRPDTYGYRVLGVYVDGVATAPSNVVVASVLSRSER